MNPLHVIIAVPVHEPTLEALAIEESLQFSVIAPLNDSREVEVELLSSAHVLFTSMPPSNHEAMTSLRWVQIASAGYSQLYPMKLSARGVRASNALGVFDVPIAEWNIAMMVNLARDMRQMIRNQHTSVWDRDTRFQRQIRGLTVGIWGYGGIGRETARLAKALGLRVHALVRKSIKARRDDFYRVPGTGDPEGALPDRIFTAGERMTFLRGLDFLVLAMPLTPENEGIVGEEELSTLPTSAYLLNPARGPLVQETALIKALERDWIAGAALDTHYEYPLPPGHPLWAFPNVILTPHIAGSSGSPRFVEQIWDIFSLNLFRLRTHQPLINELDAIQLDGH